MIDCYILFFTEILNKYGVDLEGEEFMNLMTKYDLKENGRFCYVDFLRHFILNLKPQEEPVSLLSRRRIHTPKVVVSTLPGQILRIYGSHCEKTCFRGF